MTERQHRFEAAKELAAVLDIPVKDVIPDDFEIQSAIFAEHDRNVESELRRGEMMYLHGKYGFPLAALGIDCHQPLTA